MIICDICGDTCEYTSVVPQEYRDPGIREMCKQCSTEIFAEIKSIEDTEKTDKKVKIKKMIKDIKKKNNNN